LTFLDFIIDGESLVDSESDYADDSESDDEEEESEVEDIELPQGVQAEIDTDFKCIHLP
jgi:hypothetical protein